MKVCLLKVLGEHEHEVENLRFSMDGSELLSGDHVEEYLWREEQGDWRQGALPNYPGWVVRWSSEQIMMVVKEGKQLRFQEWDWDGNVLMTSPLVQSAFGLCFSPDERWLLTGDQEGQLLLWENGIFRLQGVYPMVPKEEHLKNRDGSRRFWMSALAFSPDGKRVIFQALSRVGILHVCAFEADKPAIKKITILSQEVDEDVKISPNGAWLVTSSNEKNSLTVYDLRTLERVRTLQQAEGALIRFLLIERMWRAVAMRGPYVSGRW